MINFIYVFFLSYLFTLFGFLLGNSTKEEHKEIKSKVLLFAEELFIFYYLIIVNIFSENARPTGVLLFINTCNLTYWILQI